MRLCTRHNDYAPVWLLELDEIMHTIIINPYGYQEVMRLCTVHNHYAPTWLLESEEWGQTLMFFFGNIWEDFG